MKFKLFVSALALAASASVAQAGTLTFYNDATTLNTERFTISCTLSCEAWDGVSAFGSIGDLFDLPNSSEALEISTVNSVSGESYTSLTKTDMMGVSSASFSSSAEYILIKIGQTPNVGILRNLSENNMFTFTETGRGAGLSHISEFGEIDNNNMNPVPLPAAGWMLLAGLGGLVAAKRRKKS